MTVKELEAMKKADLQAMAKEAGVSTSGTVAELAARLALLPEEDVEDAAAEPVKTAEEAAAVPETEPEETVSTMDTAPGELVKLRVKQVYHDKERLKIMKKGATFTADAARAELLIGKGLVEKV